MHFQAFMIWVAPVTIPWVNTPCVMINQLRYFQEICLCGCWNDWEEEICQSHKKAAGRIMKKNKQMGFPCVQGYLSPVAAVYFTKDFMDKALNEAICKSLCQFHMPITHS
jgi:hypothetical protein